MPSQPKTEVHIHSLLVRLACIQKDSESKAESCDRHTARDCCGSGGGFSSRDGSGGCVLVARTAGFSGGYPCF